MQDNLIERLENCYTGAIYDVLRERGNINTILPHKIKSIDPSITDCTVLRSDCF